MMLMSHACMCVGCVHVHGCRHGDLKAGNVLLTFKTTLQHDCGSGQCSSSSSEVFLAAGSPPLTAKVRDFGLPLPLGPQDTHATMMARVRRRECGGGCMYLGACGCGKVLLSGRRWVATPQCAGQAGREAVSVQGGSAEGSCCCGAASPVSQLRAPLFTTLSPPRAVSPPSPLSPVPAAGYAQPHVSRGCAARPHQQGV